MTPDQNPPQRNDATMSVSNEMLAREVAAQICLMTPATNRRAVKKRLAGRVESVALFGH